DDIDLGLDERRCMLRELLDAQSISMRIDQKVLPLDKAASLQLFEKRDVPRRIALTKVQATEAIGPPHLLCARSQWYERRGAAEQRDELAPLHSITSSARASSVGGTVRRSIRAVQASRAFLQPVTMSPLVLSTIANNSLCSASGTLNFAIVSS